MPLNAFPSQKKKLAKHALDFKPAYIFHIYIYIEININYVKCI